MKLFLLAITQLLIASQMFGQTYFDIEGNQIKTGTISRTYNFAYSVGDTFSLFLTDSIIQYVNSTKTIIKTISYSGYRKSTEPSINIKYTTTSGQDSLSKHYSGDRLIMIYQTKFDNAGRIIYYGMKDFNADSTYDRGFEWFYEYRDSLIETGKIEIQTIFVDDAYGDKRFHFRVLNEYDNKNRKIKEVRESKPNDPMAQTTIYTYNDNDSLISEKVDGMEMLSTKGKHKNTKCDIENEYSFVLTDYNSIKQLIHQLLIDNKKLLTTDKCENYFYTLISNDRQTKLTLVKRQPYWCEGRKVTFTTNIKL